VTRSGNAAGAAAGVGLRFPGGTAVTGLRVYDWPGPDGLPGGSAHLHLASTEAYYVRSGSGLVQTLSSQGYEEHPLAPGDLMWFTPGTVHRLINHGGLELLVVMANAGLPEAGDAVLTFPPEILADPDRYSGHASLARPDRVYATDEQAAKDRRDLAIEGYLVLRDQVQADGPAALDPLYAAAAELITGRLDTWRELVAAGPVASAADSTRRLAELAGPEHISMAALAGAVVRRIDAPKERRLGMCGFLDTYESDRAH
jgi:mannose-6-phosphate isomerase-like protein (cupin superfamily)